MGQQSAISRKERKNNSPENEQKLVTNLVYLPEQRIISSKKFYLMSMLDFILYTFND